MRSRSACSRRAASSLRGHHAGGDAGHLGVRGARVLEVEERPVEHAGDRVQLVIEVGERAALAGDVDQVGEAPVQQEAPLAGDLEHIAQARRLLDVAAVRPGLPVAHCETYARPQLPLRRPRSGGARRSGRSRSNRRSPAAASRSAARPPPASCCASGAVAETMRSVGGSATPVPSQRPQVHRRGDEDARPRHGGERGGDVGRIERPLGAQRMAVRERHEHARLEAIHDAAAAPWRRSTRACSRRARAAGPPRARTATRRPEALAVRERACRSNRR